MISFDPNEYRQRLSSALGIRDTSAIGLGAAGGGRAPTQIENPYDNPNEDPYRPPQEEAKQQGGMPNPMSMLNIGGQGGQGGMPNLGGMIPGMGGGEQGGGMTPNLGDMTGVMMGGGGVIDESGAMGGAQKQGQGGAGAGFSLPMGQDGKIETRPPDLEAEADPEKLSKAKTIDDVFDAAPEKTQNQYMNWWEKSYGDINSKYDRMRGELGEYKKLPEKPSRKQMFMLLLGYGARMANNMRVGREGSNSDIDPMAASDDAFSFAQDMTMGNRMSEGAYRENLSAIEQARGAELKAIGTKGDAMNKASEINYRDTQAANLGKADERVVDDRGYVFTMGKDNKLQAVMRPDGKGQLRQRLPETGDKGGNSEFERAYQSYINAHGYDSNGKKLTGAAWKEVEKKANDFARYGSREKDENTDPRIGLREAARDRANTVMRSSPNTFRDAESPEEVGQQLGKMEEEEYQRSLRTNLGSSPVGRGKGPRARAPERSEGYVRQHPEALEDFVGQYGYVPEGMEGNVTPAIKNRLGL